MDERASTARARRVAIGVGLAAVLAAACGTSGRAATVQTTTATATTLGVATSTAPSSSPPDTVATDPWAADLAYLDERVRALHPNPFAIHPKDEWVAKLADLEVSLPKASDDERIVQMAGLIALLDTHSSFDGLTKPDGPLAFRFYQLQLYGFSEGWFVVRAKDPSLVGAQLVSVAGIPVADVVKTVSDLIPADNPSGKLNGLDSWLTAVEYLHGLGIVKDLAAPHFVLQRPDGQQVSIDPGISPDETEWENDIGISAPPVGKAPEAIVRHGEALWTKLDAATKTFVVSYNDYGDPSAAIAAMKAALDSKRATRVVLDMRYLQGGNAQLASPLIDALAGDPRINKPGKLVVLIGRQNYSAGTVVAGRLDHGTQALLVGEPTPARADNFLCDCRDIKLPNSGYTVRIPTVTLKNGDTRDSVAPDVVLAPSAAAYFAGKDPVLQAAILGKL